MTRLSTAARAVRASGSACRCDVRHGGGDFTSGPGYLSTETFSLLPPPMLIGLGIALGTGAIAGEEERGTWTC